MKVELRIERQDGKLQGRIVQVGEDGQKSGPVILEGDGALPEPDRVFFDCLAEMIWESFDPQGYPYEVVPSESGSGGYMKRLKSKPA